MSAVIDICNLALRHITVGKTIASLTERSAEAIACNALYPQVRDETLRDFEWPFATAVESLALVGTSMAPGWAFTYQYPADCIRIRQLTNPILCGHRLPLDIAYRLRTSGTDTLIDTNLEEASAEYTVRADDPSRYPPDFVQTVALLLASYLAPSITGGDPGKLGARALQLYQWRVAGALTNAANEERRGESRYSDLLSTRNT